MKTILLSYVLLLLASTTACSQNYLFKMYRFECSELYNIDLKKPKGFKVIDGITPFKVNEKKTIGMFYRMTLESKTKDCLILFPYYCVSVNLPDVTMKIMAYDEVKAALNLNPDDKMLNLDSAKYIKMIAKDNMDDYFNADTVFICQFSLPKPYKEIYSQCVGLNVVKTGHPSAMIKMLLTEEGKKKEEEYIQILFNAIHYNDIASVLTQEKIAKTIKKMKTRFIFNMKRYKYCGYTGFYDKARR